METNTVSQNDLRTRLNDMLAMLAEGKFLETMEEFLHDDAVLQEGNDEPKRGKKLNMDLEAKLLADVVKFGGYKVSSIGVGEDHTYYEAVLEFTLKDGTEVSMQQCVVDTWLDGKIIHERFYHA